MKYLYHNERIAGVAIPLSALRTTHSCGIGEYADLKELGLWCQKVGLKLIQILPIHDTGLEPTPYAAQSSLALNPVYLRLQAIPGNEKYVNEILGFTKEYNAKTRLAYQQVYLFKQKILRHIFEDNYEALCFDENFRAFLKENSWLDVYASYKVLKERHELQSWKSFPILQDPHAQEIRKFFEQNEKDCLFYAWQQYHCHLQLLEAAQFLDKQGVMLKGDIPILMNEDSADVWAWREFFDLNYRVGAPPDMFSPQGQNWGFPAYRWDALEKDNYSWWRSRIAQANRYFHAFRIDHVLGFFRIWKIPHRELSGLLGFFSPGSYILHEELRELGFDEGRIVWLSEPHIPGGEMRMRFGQDWLRIVKEYLVQVNEEDLYKFALEIKGERDIFEREKNEDVREFLLYWWRQKALIPVANKHFFPAWQRKDVFSYHTLSPEEKHKLESLVEKHRKLSEEIWREQALKLLSFMKENHEMLVCAEDLGDLPSCTPEVLSELGILSLKVERWCRHYKVEGEPYIAVEEYPVLSVATSSVHDSSPLRLWWESELSQEERRKYLEHLGMQSDEIPSKMNPELANKILMHLSKAASKLMIIPFQDLLAMTDLFYGISPQEERINVPGTVSEKNWTYRLPLTLEELMRLEGDFLLKVQKLSQR
ncbi:MAG: 4-alpha-glucanotransferase [Leptospiraceae bacterium]|nr:4-alpha-glucanotransferase [Leptospiraceae bacterium]MDW8307154.1 4-alpha-glucanotransferase [Leptospiraceae bacterium]